MKHLETGFLDFTGNNETLVDPLQFREYSKSSLSETFRSNNVLMSLILIASQSSSVSSAPSTGRLPDPPPRPFQRQGSQQASVTEDTEDTMKNLRKTFAGIFGDM